MRSEEENFLEELAQIRLHKTIMMDIKLSQYVLIPRFKNYVKSIPKKICKECGVEYRITHWCGTHYQQIWIPNWKRIIQSNFESAFPKPLEMQEKKPQVSKSQEKHLKPWQEKSKLLIENTKQPLKNERVHQKSVLSTQSSKYIPSVPSVSKEQKTKPKPIPNQGFQEKKLSINHISQLTQKERSVFEQLLNWRNLQATRENKPQNLIARDIVLMAIVYYRVASTHDLMQISGITSETARKYGTDILRIMIRYGMATGIKTYQVQRKQTGLQKIVRNKSSNNNKIIFGAICCIFTVILFIILANVL